MDYNNITLTKEQVIRLYKLLHSKASKQIVSDEEYEIINTLRECIYRNDWMSDVE
jgi:hypothetical protein